MNSPGSGPSISEERAAALAHGPVPVPTSETREFWAATAQHELHMPYCQECERFFFYPRATCRYCHSEDVTWKQVSGRGTLLSYVINHLPFPEFGSKDPQVIAIIALEEGVNFLSQIVTDDPRPEAFTLGMPLTVTFIERGEITLPFFIASESEGAHDHA